jgi:hypothetical protein
VLGHGSLCLSRRDHRVRGSGKGEKEGVPLGVDLDASVGAKGITQEPAVLGQDLAVGLGQVLE